MIIKTSCLRRWKKELPQTEVTSKSANAGDLIEVEVVTPAKRYNEIEDIEGSLHSLLEGMKFWGCLGKRRATEGFSGNVPDLISIGDKIALLGGGGVLGECTASPPLLGPPPLVKVTKIPASANIRDVSLKSGQSLENMPPIIMILGTRMNVGKTTLCTNLVRHLAEDHDLTAVKLTGVSRIRDILSMKHAGAKTVFDFTDAGLMSTLHPEETVLAAKEVLAAGKSSEIIIVECGAGLLSAYSVDHILKDPDIKKATKVVILAALDVVGAYGSHILLKDYGYDIDIVTGPCTDTQAGKLDVQKTMNIPTANGRRELAEIVATIKRKLQWNPP